MFSFHYLANKILLQMIFNKNRLTQSQNRSFILEHDASRKCCNLICHACGATSAKSILESVTRVPFQYLGIYIVSLCDIQGRTIKPLQGLVNFVPDVAYHFCLNVPAAFSQPGNGLIREPCSMGFGQGQINLSPSLMDHFCCILMVEFEGRKILGKSEIQ